MRWRQKTRLSAKSVAIWKIAEIAWFCDKFSDRRILEWLSATHWTDQIQRKSCAHLYYSPLSLTAAAHASSNAHTHTGISGPRPIRGGGPHFTISDWFRPRYEPNVSVVEQQRLWVAETFFFFFFCKWLDAPVRPTFFFSRTLEKLGRTCDQIGRTLEPCIYIYISLSMELLHKIFKFLGKQRWH